MQKALGVQEGDLLPLSKGDVEQRLDDIPGVVESHLEAVCCQNGKVTLYVGIEERGAAHFELHEDSRRRRDAASGSRLGLPPFRGRLR